MFFFPFFFTKIDWPDKTLKYFAKKRILLLFFFLDFVATMAQLAEHSTIKRRVRGSNPRGSTKFISTSTWHTSHTYFCLKFTHLCFFFWMFFFDIYFWNSHTVITSHTYISYHLTHLTHLKHLYFFIYIFFWILVVFFLDFSYFG